MTISGTAARPDFDAWETCRVARGTRGDFFGCWSNQKTIWGAVEMYRLDRNVKATTLDQKLFEELKKGKYLMSIPEDPSQGPGSEVDYYFLSDGKVGCRFHGVSTVGCGKD
jgi:hypothetical protein